jgi:enterochelin esterase-like enzyme
MSRYLVLALAACCVVAQAADNSAPPPADSRPAPSNIPGSDYPRVYPDNRVEFRLKDPEAREVQVLPTPGAVDNGLGKGPYDMVRSDDGVWSVTIPSAVPGLHMYHFIVDGLQVNDPGSEVYFNGFRPTSGVEVPERDVDYYLPRDVPHGVVQEFWYHSKVTGTTRRAMVYTPPGYDRDTRSRYPVLYLQHGASENETSWLQMGKMNFIMDNLLADKKAVPMLVVMESGYAVRAGEVAKSEANASSGFEDLLLQDLIPTIDAHYRTLTGRESRALAGLSMGAAQAQAIGFAHLDKFAYIGDFSGGFVARDFKPESSYNGIFTKPQMLNSQLKLLFVGTGTAELYYKYLKPFHEKLDEIGVKHVYFESAGTSHEYLTWRRSLNDFVPRLFRGR